MLRNYAQFVAGIAEVAALEADLITAHVCSKVRCARRINTLEHCFQRC